MSNFTHVLGLAVTFAAVVTFLVEPAHKAAKEANVKSTIRAERATSDAEYETIFLFSLLGLLLTLALLPQLVGSGPMPLPPMG